MIKSARLPKSELVISLELNSTIVWKLPDTLFDIQKEVVRQAVIFNRGNKALTARDLGVARATIRRWIKEMFSVEEIKTMYAQSRRRY